MSRSFVLSGLAVVMILFATHHVVSRQKASEQGTPPIAPAESPFAEQVVGAGLVEAQSENIKIGTPLSGIVDQVPVVVGQRVRPGDPLFVLDKRQIVSDIAVAEAKLLAAQAQAARLDAMPRPEDLPPIEAQRREVEAAVEEMEDLFRRTQSLSERKVATEELLTTRRSKLAAAQAQLDRIKAEEARMRSGAWQADKAVSAAAIAQARAELEQARTQLDRHTIAAPAAGHAADQAPEFTVLQLNVRPGETVSAAWTQALVVLGDVQTKHVRVDIDEHDVSRYRPDLPAIAQMRGGGKERYPLRFRRVEPYIIPKRSLTGESTERVDTRVLQVLYQIDETGRPPVYVGQQMDVFIDSGHPP